ncbi:hypothetical protein [Roseibium sp.]|uniref:hypothetical protein n=1 Tax=Roseibium sp. TaxID=1936156 RepID=UPI0032645269
MKSGCDFAQGFGEFSFVDMEIGESALHDEFRDALGLLLEDFFFALMQLCDLCFDVMDLFGRGFGIAGSHQVFLFPGRECSIGGAR